MVVKVPRSKPTGEDVFRALSYLATMAWGAVFFLFPPMAFQNQLQFYTQLGLLGITVGGGLLALIGSLTRVDVKMELPGIMVFSLGLVAYSWAQIYFAFIPVPEVTDPSQRYALAVYTLLPLAYLAPRAWGLFRFARKASARARATRKQAQIAEALLKNGEL